MRKIFYGVAVLALSSGAYAFSLGIDPAHLDFKTKPGEAEVQQLAVVNDTNDTIQVDLSVEEWKLMPDGAKQFGAPGFSKSGCGPWLTLEPSMLKLAGNEKKMLTVRLLTPADSQGGHQAVVFAQNIPSAKDMQGKVPFVGKVGALVIQETVGSTIPALEVKDVGFDLGTHGQTMNLFLRNTGNCFVRSSGSAMILKEGSGEVLVRKDLPKWQSLPGDVLKPQVVFEKPLPAGKYIMLVTIQSDALEPVVLEEAFTI